MDSEEYAMSKKRKRLEKVSPELRERERVRERERERETETERDSRRKSCK